MAGGRIKRNRCRITALVNEGEDALMEESLSGYYEELDAAEGTYDS